MTDTATATADRMRAIAAELTTAGLHTDLHETRASVDITATAHRPGCREIEAIVDEDGYVELRYWTRPDATPAQVSGAITRAIYAITHSQ